MNLTDSTNDNRINTTQQGSALMLALFAIIVLTLLGATLVKVLSTTSESIAQEVIGTRALMAANSAMQAELSLVFPLNSAAPVCNLTNSYTLQDSGNDIEGLYHCTANTTCNVYHTDSQSLLTYYRLTSTGQCGSAQVTAEAKDTIRSVRTIQVEARTL